jgi:hypothetical protein
MSRVSERQDCFDELLAEHILPNYGHRFGETFLLKRIQIFRRCFRRVFEALLVVPCRSKHEAGSQVEEVRDEFVRVLRFNSEGLKSFNWKVPRVARGDNVGTPTDCGCKYVPVIRIGEVETLN